MENKEIPEEPVEVPERGIVIVDVSKQEIQLKDPNTCEYFKEVGCIKDICTCYTLVSKQ